MRQRAAGQLAALPHHHEPAAHRQRERRGDEEAARFDAREEVGPVRPHPLGERLDAGAPRARVGEQRGDVAEQDPRFREVRHVADEALEVHVGALGRRGENNLQGSYRPATRPRNFLSLKDWGQVPPPVATSGGRFHPQPVRGVTAATREAAQAGANHERTGCTLTPR